MNETLYFLQYGGGPVTEVTMEEFVAAEHAAGFHNTVGEPDKPATAGFSAPGIRGTVRYGDDESFYGHQPRECGDHRTVGYRAWCLDCSEWCYPKMPCLRCAMAKLKPAIECVLLDHEDELDGDNVDANLSELAYVYEQLTGWTVKQEKSNDG